MEDRILSDEILLALIKKNSGGGGTTNYNDLRNQPQINGVTLSGDKSASDLGLASTDDVRVKDVKVDNASCVDSNGNAIVAIQKSTGVYSYEISTYNLSNTKIVTKHDGVVTDTKIISYATAITKQTIDDRFTLQYVNAEPSWTIELLIDSKDASAGTKYQWNYGQNPPISDIDFQAGSVQVQLSAAYEELNNSIKDNRTAISGIKDGQSIDSFADVETALSGKQDVLTAGDYIDITSGEISVNREIPNETVSYEFKTKGTSEPNIAIIVTKSSNGSVVWEREYQYLDVLTPIVIDDVIKFGYQWVNAGQWTYEMLVASDSHAVGYRQSWGYLETKDYTEDFSLIDNTGLKLVIKSEMDTALAGKQDVLTAGDYISLDGNAISVKRTLDVPLIRYEFISGAYPNMTIKKYVNEVFDSENTYGFTGTAWNRNIDGFFTLYSKRAESWTPIWRIVLIKDSNEPEHEAGYATSWNVQSTYDFSYSFNSIDVSGQKLIIKSEMDTALSGKQNTLTFDDAPTANSSNPVKSGGVKSAIDAAVASAYHHAGTKTCAELVAGLLVAGNEGNVYNMTDSGTTTADFIDGAGQPIKAGDNVGIAKISDGVYKFDLLSGFVDTSNFVQKSVTAGLIKNDGTIDTVAKQPVTDNNLTTTDKTVVGAINEHEGDVNSLKSGLTNLDNEVNGDATTHPYADVITIEDAVPANVSECGVKIESVQDLHGYDHPWVGGAGKNKLDVGSNINEWIATSDNGVTIISNGDISSRVTANFNASTGSIKVTNYDNTGWWWMSKEIKLAKNTNYKVINLSATKKIVGLSSLAGGTTGTEITISDGVFNSGDYDYWIVSIYPYQLDVTSTMVMLATETDATFAPYTNYCPITGHTEASVQRDGKNLMNPALCEGLFYDLKVGSKRNITKIIDSSVTVVDNKYSKNATTSYTSYMSMVSDKLATGTYKVSIRCSSESSSSTRTSLYVLDKNYVITRVWNSTADKTWSDEQITLTGDESYIGVYIGSSSPNNVMSIEEPSIVKGSTATPYEPYTGKTYTISLGDTVYGGTLRIDSNGNTVMTVDRGYAEFDGSSDENWTYEYHASADNFYISLQDANPTSSSDEIISNMFTASYSTMWVSGAHNLNVKPNIGISNVNDWKTWLSSNPLQVCYELATPTTIQLTPQQIQLLKGQNTLTASTGQISVTVNGVSGSIGAVQEQVNEKIAELESEKANKAVKQVSSSLVNVDETFTINLYDDVQAVTIMLYRYGHVASLTVPSDVFPDLASYNEQYLLVDGASYYVKIGLQYDTTNKTMSVKLLQSTISGGTDVAVKIVALQIF